MSRNHFTLAEAATLAGTTANALRQLLFKGVISFGDENDIAPVAPGGTRLLSLTSVFELVIMHRLMATGMKAERAWEAAWSFGEIGDWQIAWEGVREPAPERGPSEFYAEGATWMIADTSGEVRIVNVHRDTPGFDLLAGRTPAVVLDLGLLWAELRSKVEALRLPTF